MSLMPAQINQLNELRKKWNQLGVEPRSLTCWVSTSTTTPLALSTLSPVNYPMLLTANYSILGAPTAWSYRDLGAYLSM